MMGTEGHLVALAYSVVAVGPVLWAAAGRQGDGALSQRAFRDSAVRLSTASGHDLRSCIQ